MDTLSIPLAMAGQLVETASELEGRLTYDHLSPEDKLAPPAVIHPGDPFGRIVTWAWEVDRVLTVRAMTAFMDGLIRAAREAGTPEPKLAAVLEGLTVVTGMETPWRRVEFTALLAEQTPRHYGRPI